MLNVKAILVSDTKQDKMKSDKHSSMHEILGIQIIEYVKKALMDAGVTEILEERPESFDAEALYLFVLDDLAQLSAAGVECAIKQPDTVIPCYQEDEVAIVSVKGALADKQLCELIAILPQNTMYSEDNIPRDVFKPVNTRERLALASEALGQQVCSALMANGVTIIRPSMTFISPFAVIGQDTVIYPNTYIMGKTIIGANCKVGPDSSLTDMTIGDNVTIKNSTLEKSVIGAFTSVGPYAYVRPNSVIGEHCKIGDFVEVKNSTLGNGAKASHLAYIGDSDIGERVNFSCGAITSNYDGKRKHRCTVGDDVFIGCNTNLVAPVTVGRGAYVAAGSTITDHVPEGEVLAIARARQVNKIGWTLKP